jgi:hypothetical protein
MPERAYRDEWIIAWLFIVIGAIRVTLAIATAEVFGVEATGALLLLAFGMFQLGQAVARRRT